MKRIYLCKPNDKKYTQINGIRENTVSITKNLKDYDEIEFEVDKFINTDYGKVVSNGYDDLHNGMEIYYDEGILFKLEEPEIFFDGNIEYKRVVAYSKEKELEKRKVVALQAHTGTTGSMELMATVNEGKSPLSADFKWSTFKNEDVELSVIDRILANSGGWTSGFISESLKGKEVSLDVENVGIYGLLTSTLSYKLNCVFTFD